jgi:hypothetical protein
VYRYSQKYAESPRWPNEEYDRVVEEEFAHSIRAELDLVRLITKRRYLDGEDMAAIALSSTYHRVLSCNLNGPPDLSIARFHIQAGTKGFEPAISRLPSRCVKPGYTTPPRIDGRS